MRLLLCAWLFTMSAPSAFARGDVDSSTYDALPTTKATAHRDLRVAPNLVLAFSDDDDDDIVCIDDDDGDAPCGDDVASDDTGVVENGSDATVTDVVDTRSELDVFLAGEWLDPPGEFWEPRRGRRSELGITLGGEAGLANFAPSPEVRIPTFGGAAVTPVFRLYPVDQVAIVFGQKAYLGLEAPAAGTGASTVFTPFIGVRYDLIRETRFSVLTDVTSGPTIFVFADPSELGNRVTPFNAQWALGAEISAALAARYSLGPTTFESRFIVGGRAGSAQALGRPEGDVGPFSALYAGIDVGITWSFFADGTPPTKTHDQIPVGR